MTTLAPERALEQIDGNGKLLPLPPDCVRVNGNFWKPNPRFVAELAAYLKGRKVLEIFSGNGYLAALLAAHGINITATTSFSGHDSHESGLYFPVQEMRAFDAVAEFGDASDILLVCWPTATSAVLQAAFAWGFEKPIVFIGEITDYTKCHLGGCATDEFFEHFSISTRFSTYKGNPLEHAVAGHISPTQVTSIGR